MEQKSSFIDRVSADCRSGGFRGLFFRNPPLRQGPSSSSGALLFVRDPPLRQGPSSSSGTLLFFRNPPLLQEPSSSSGTLLFFRGPPLLQGPLLKLVLQLFIRAEHFTSSTINEPLFSFFCIFGPRRSLINLNTFNYESWGTFLMKEASVTSRPDHVIKNQGQSLRV